jgi:putative resolvase
MKLSVNARQVGVSYHTAFRWFKCRKIQGRQMDSGTILIMEPIGEPQTPDHPVKVAIYTRVSAVENINYLEGQADRLRDYCAAKAYPVAWVVKEISSGVNDTRPKLIKLLNDPTARVIVVEQKDCLTRIGYNYLEQLLKMQDRRIEVINLAENGKEDLIQDFVSIVTSFCVRLYGQRCSKRKTERLIAEISHSPAASVGSPEGHA